MQNHSMEVFDNCCNYDFIVSYDVSNDNCLSQKLVQFYKDYVFFNWSSTSNIKSLDNIIYKYITDNDFKEYIYNKYLELEDILLVFEVLLKLYNEYEQEKIKLFDNTVWI